MKSYAEVASSPVLFVLVVIGLAFVAGLCVIFYRKTYNRALELGISKETLSAVKKNTVSLTIVPSISILSVCSRFRR